MTTFQSSHSDTDLVLTPRELREIYFHGIIFPPEDRVLLTDAALEFHIRSATAYIEKQLSILVLPQEIEETKDFYRDDWYEWGRLDTNYPVREALDLRGFLGTARQLQYPVEWLSVRQRDTGTYDRAIHVVPVTEAAVAFTSALISIPGGTPHIAITRHRYIPNYWRVRYSTGFLNIPREILDAIGKIASIGIFNVLGDTVIGAGIASQSLGFDGLSQSVATTSSPENAAYSARIKQYMAEMKIALPQLKSVYAGIELVVL